ncbi:hypothetical protein AG1IA_01910 [Rhizoctonia solani AG-1 IA]|uniref:Uncharacterized protein n=1 Tax=Thanatephorus cucumeris (strain AG1-IA) TaxID=983506 RepID=L8X5Z9_THACA|nr:hypothetical protein AG1IA_01910 [Rhizoctonia solani AG-1 IA]
MNMDNNKTYNESTKVLHPVYAVRRAVSTAPPMTTSLNVSCNAFEPGTSRFFSVSILYCCLRYARVRGGTGDERREKERRAWGLNGCHGRAGLYTRPAVTEFGENLSSGQGGTTCTLNQYDPVYDQQANANVQFQDLTLWEWKCVAWPFFPTSSPNVLRVQLSGITYYFPAFVQSMTLCGSGPPSALCLHTINTCALSGGLG